MGSNPYSNPTENSIGPSRAISGDRILLAISGGPASAAAAVILQEQGYNIELLHFDFSAKFRAARSEFSCVLDRRKSAEDVAGLLGLPLTVVSGDGYFQQMVLSPLQENAAQGLGFEPCSSCHSKFKIESLYTEALNRGIAAIATGHFVRISTEPDLGVSLWRAKDHALDQSFLLSRTRSTVLKSLVTPMGHLKLTDIDRLLHQKSIPLHMTKEQDLFCSAHRNHSLKYLAERAAWAVDRERKAYALTGDLKAMAEVHSGGELQFHWGQSDGLEKIKDQALARGFKKAAAYVVTAIDPSRHYVYLGPPKQLKRKELVLENVRWIVSPDLRKIRKLGIVSRGQHVDSVSVEALIDNAVHLRVLTEADFFEIGPGDLVALYDKDLCMGSGEVYSGF